MLQFIKRLFSNKKITNTDYLDHTFTKFHQMDFINHINDEDWKSVEIKPLVEYIPKESDLSIGTIIFDYKTDLEFLNGRIFYKFKAFEKEIDGINIYKYEFREINRQAKEVIDNE